MGEDVARTIAENCILEHESGSVGLPAAATSSMINEPSDVTKFIQQLVPKLRKLLSNQEDAFKFTCALLADFPTVQGEGTRSAVAIYRGDPEKVPAERTNPAE